MQQPMPISALGAAAIGAGLSTVGGAFTSMLNHSAQRDAEERSYQRSLALMEAQNKFNVDMWERANRYNAPSNQLKLMKQAGINPAMFDMRGQNPASEVTSADASIPYNSRAGSEYDALGLSRLGDSSLQALQVDAQMAKLRTDIKYQNLLNRDLENEIKAKEQKISSPLNDLVPEGEMTVYPDLNAYEENRYKGRYDYTRNKLGFDLDNEQLRVYRATVDDLKKMPHQQLRKLEEEVDDLIAKNVFNADDLGFLKKYGINPRDTDGLTMLFKIALRDPTKFHEIIDAILGAGKQFSGALVDSVSKGASEFFSGADLDDILEKASVPYAVAKRIYRQLGSHRNPKLSRQLT